MSFLCFKNIALNINLSLALMEQKAARKTEGVRLKFSRNMKRIPCDSAL